MTTTRARRAAMAAAALLTLAGCGGDPAPAAAPTTAAVATTTPAATTAPSPTGSPTPDMAAAEDADADAALQFGKTATVGTLAKATAYRFKQPVAASAPRPNGQPGLTWAAAEVKVCATNTSDEYDGITVTNGPWKLVYADDTEMGASNIIYNQFPQPEYPTGEKDLPDGKCVRGWITFRALKDKRPAYVAYEPEDQPAVLWAVK